MVIKKESSPATTCRDNITAKEAVVKKGYREIHRGEVYIVDLGTDKDYCEQQGIRPVVIMQNDIGNCFSATVTIVPMTSVMKKTTLPTHYVIQNADFLKKKSMALGESLRVIDKRRIIGKNPIGTLEENDMNGVCEAVKENLGFYLPIENELQ